MRDLKKNCQHPVVVVRGPWPTTYSRLTKSKIRFSSVNYQGFIHCGLGLVTIELKELNQKESNPGRSCLGCKYHFPLCESSVHHWSHSVGGKVHIDTFTFRNDSDTAEEISKKQVAPVVERWAKLIEISK